MASVSHHPFSLETGIKEQYGSQQFEHTDFLITNGVYVSSCSVGCSEMLHLLEKKTFEK